MMTFTRKRNVAALLLTAAVFAVSCSRQAAPAKPKPGTPAFFWNQARDAYAKGDYIQAQRLFVDLAAGKSEFASKAQPIAIILTHSATHAYMELAEKYAAGAKRARSNPAVFYRLTGEYKTKAKNSGMRFAETVRMMDPGTLNQEVVLALLPAQGPAVGPPQYKKIESGMPLPAAELPEVELHVLKHEAMRVFLIALGTPDNPGKARSLYTGEEIKLPARDFRQFLAVGLCETAEFFGPKKLAQPTAIQATMVSEAKRALEGAADSKEVKSLRKKLADLEKGLKSVS